MSETIIIIDSSEILEGKLEDVKTAMTGLVAFAEANEPRMVAYHVYLSEGGTRVTVLQVHPDSSSAEFHMKVAGPAFKRFAELLDLSGIETYGRPNQDLVERLRLKAQMLGSGNVVVHELHAGFARFGDPNRTPPLYLDEPWVCVPDGTIKVG